MPHSFPSIGSSAKIVGRTPWSARDALVPLLARRIKYLPLARSRPGGRLRTRGSALQLVQMSGSGKTMWHQAESLPHKIYAFSDFCLEARTERRLVIDLSALNQNGAPRLSSAAVISTPPK